MIQRDDILSMEYLKKTEFTGCHQGMRYRLEQTADPEDPEGGKKLLVTVWPEPFNFLKTPEEKKQRAMFSCPREAARTRARSSSRTARSKCPCMNAASASGRLDERQII